MRFFVFCFLLFSFGFNLFAQYSDIRTRSVAVCQGQMIKDSMYLEPQWFDGHMLSLAVTIEKVDIPLDLHVGLETTKGFRSIDPGCEVNEEDFAFVSKLEILEESESGWIYFFYRHNDLTNQHINITYHVHHIPLKKPSDSDLINGRQTDCSCPQPSYIPRSSWGSDFQLTNEIYVLPATLTDVTHLIVHHSASSNQSNNWPAVVASFFAYHTMTNGWQDIGYNWLIDPLGNIYQGRGGGEDVRGAHMCGYNNNTMGVCVIGTYNDAEPTEAALKSLEQLLSYKACQKSFSSEGSAPIVSYSGHMFRISGHRDGCAPNYTECPGAKLHAFLPVLRKNCTDYMVDSCMLFSSTADFEKPICEVFVKDEWVVVETHIHGMMTITNVSGQCVRKENISPGSSIFEMPEVAGIYFIHVTDGMHKFTKKVFRF